MLEPLHGGTDAGPVPRYDFSTNANALGPNPQVLESLGRADPAHYPDPAYTFLREQLAAYHHATPEEVVVGAGASELILRLVRAYRGPVLVLNPTFSEYARCARAEGEEVLEAHSPDEFISLLPKAKLAFLCSPNNPTGEVWPLGFLESVAGRTRLVLDLAYAPLSEQPVPVPAGAILLFAPNKAHGVTGLRAAYALLPGPDPRLRHLAPSWVLDIFGEAFLGAILTPGAQAWLDRARPALWAWRQWLASDLRQLGFEVRESAANFLLVQVGEAAELAAALRVRGIRVRDCASFGLPRWLRLSAQPSRARKALLSALSEVRGG